MVQFHRTCNTTSYWSAIVSIALTCTIFELLDVEECRDLTGHSRLLEMTPFNSIDRIPR